MPPSRWLWACFMPTLALGADKTVGWTRDDVLVVPHTFEGQQPIQCSECTGDDFSVTHEEDAVVYELPRTRDGRTFVLDTSGMMPAPTTEEAEFAEYLAKHPVTAPTFSRTGPRGQGTLEVTLSGKGEWKGDRFHWRRKAAKGKSSKRPTSAKASLWLRQGSLRTFLGEAELWSDVGVLAPTWSPSGAFIAFLEEDDDLSVAVRVGPAVEVVADEALSKKLVDVPDEDSTTRTGVRSWVAGLLWAQGFNTQRTATAQQKREKSVVYFAAGQEALARKVAAVVPGGATVEPLTWKSDAGAVVALGAAVLEAAPGR